MIEALSIVRAAGGRSTFSHSPKVRSVSK